MRADFPTGSVIVCPDCWRPVFALERGIGPLDRGGRAASAFRPVTESDIRWLLGTRPDVPNGWQLLVRQWWYSHESDRVREAARPTAGDEAVCPNCGGTWVRFVERAGESVGDRGYEIQLLDIPPAPARALAMDRTHWTDLDPAHVTAKER